VDEELIVRRHLPRRRERYDMPGLRRLLGALILVGACVISIGAWAAAPAALDSEPQKPVGASAIGDVGIYQLDVEMTVKNWVLCISQPLAEGLLKARETGRETFLNAYSQAAAAHTCGQMPQMHLKLQKAVYESAPDASNRGTVFNALVNLSGAWATAFVVPVE
jgi:hypothetical protein